jgi:ArsR family transcriptional regulator, arsenate/arsenite/antimonite-responsive transcriptional repressor
MKEEMLVFKALSDPNRVRILKMLQIKTLCVCEIRAILELATSTVSSHLSLLRESGLIIEKKEGKWINYMLNPKPESPILSSISAMLNYWFEDNEVILKDKELVGNVCRSKLCKK